MVCLGKMCSDLVQLLIRISSNQNELGKEFHVLQSRDDLDVTTKYACYMELQPPTSSTAMPLFLSFFLLFQEFLVASTEQSWFKALLEIRKRSICEISTPRTTNSHTKMS